MISSRYRCLSLGLTCATDVFGASVVVVISSSSDFLAALLTDSHRDGLAGVLVQHLASRDPSRLVAVGTHDHHVAHVNRRLLRDDATGLRATRGRGDLRVLTNPVDALDQDALLAGVGLDDLALEAAIFAGDHLDGVTLADLQPCHDLQHLRGERDDPHELLLAQLTADRAEDAGSTRIAAVLDEDSGVLVKLDVRAVGPPTLLH